MEIKDLVTKYSDSPVIRAIVQLIPNFGGAIDTILSEKGNKWRQERIESFLKGINANLEELTKENLQLREEIKTKMDSEEFYYYFIKCAQESTQSIDRDKVAIFSRIVTKALVINDEADYIELFINITKELSGIEISKLANIWSSSRTYYISYQGYYVDLERYKNDIKENRLFSDSDNIPSQYHISENELFTLNRLEKSMLIIRRIYEQNGSLSVGWSTGVQSTISQLGYREKITIEISEFGKKYCEWIIEK